MHYGSCEVNFFSGWLMMGGGYLGGANEMSGAIYKLMKDELTFPDCHSKNQSIFPSEYS